MSEYISIAYRPDPTDMDRLAVKEDLETYTYKLSSLAPQHVYASTGAYPRDAR